MMTREQLMTGVARFMERDIPFNQHMGLKVDHIEAGRVILRLPWHDRLVGDPIRPAVHGGVTAFMIDNAGGIATFSTFDSVYDRASTIDLRVDYLGPGPTGADLVCEARVVRRGKRVAFTRMEMWSGSVPAADEDRPPFAIGQGTYSVYSADESLRAPD